MKEGISPDDGITPINNGWDVFHQPSGLSSDAENVENLPVNYYSTVGMSDDFIRVFIHGEYGRSLLGRPVWEGFRPDFHMAKQQMDIPLSGTKPIVVGMDLGLTPAAVFTLQDALGRMLVLDEAVAFGVGIQRFSREYLKPKVFQRFPNRPIVLVVDPAGRQRAQTDERTAIEVLRGEGWHVRVARSQSLTDRLGSVEDFLTRHVDGNAAMLIDPRCLKLKAAMLGGYCYHKKLERIDKNKHSHIADALQYAAMDYNLPSGKTMHGQARELTRVTAEGWT